MLELQSNLVIFKYKHIKCVFPNMIDVFIQKVKAASICFLEFDLFLFYFYVYLAVNTWEPLVSSFW